MSLVVKPQVRKFQCVETTFTRGPTTNTSLIIDQGSLSWTDKRGNIENPGWRDAIKNHRGATTPNSGERYKFMGHTSGLVETKLRSINPTTAHDEVTRRHSGDLITAAEILPWSFYSNPSLKQKVGNDALVGFLNRCADARRQLEGGVFIGELKETLSLIARPGKAIRKLLNEYSRDVRRRTRSFKRTGRRIDPSRISDANKIVSDTWLEYSFGLKPLMSDVKSGAEALSELLHRARDFQPVSYFAVDQQDTTPAGKATRTKDYNLFTIYLVNQREISEIICRIKGQVMIEVENPITMAKEVLGFEPSDFIPTVYNLIPYSFLLDYFSNMGDVIQAWTFPREKLAWFNRTYRVSRRRDISGNFLRVANNDPKYVTDHTIAPSFTVKVEATRFDRDSSELGYPSLVFHVPGFGLKWLNIAGLAHMRTL